MNRLTAALFIVFLLPSWLCAQEVLLDLESNTAIKKYLIDHKDDKKKNSRALVAEPLSLPFLENFRQDGVYPDPDKFIDSNVFVNNTWAIAPLDRGVATFDAVDKFGSLYKRASSSPFIADYLTSRKINTTLDAAGNPTDMMSFFFFYQPQGRGIAPEDTDSLVLQFLADSTIIGGVSDSVWINVWSTPGISYEDFKLANGTDFGQIRINLDKAGVGEDAAAVFFHENFRFRFYNYASLADKIKPTFRSNVDQWHVDLIYLNVFDLDTEFFLKELSFSEAPASFLAKGYQAVPYRQYKRDVNVFRKPRFLNYISNLDSKVALTHYEYTVRQAGQSTFYTEYNGGDRNLEPYYTYGFQDSIAHSNPNTYNPKNPGNFAPFPTNIDADTASFIIEHTISSVGGGNLTGDLVRFKQKFYDYYALDKGVPEKGYALQGLGTAAAVQFQVVEADSIRGVYMYFNRTAGNANEEQFFDLSLWRDNGFGKLPSNKVADEILLSANLRPKWIEDDIYKFVRFDFENPVYLVPGLYYIGWVKQSVGALNVGFDTYNDNRDHNFVRVNEVWRKSAYAGSIMIRPIVYKEILAGVSETAQLLSQTEIYPNPSAKHINIDLAGSLSERPDKISIRVSNLLGQTVINRPFQKVIDISTLSKGMYIITFLDEMNNTSFSTKLMVTE